MPFQQFTIDADVVDEFVQMILEAGESVFPVISQREGECLANLLEGLNQWDAANTVREQVWIHEDETDRDPVPWINGHGRRNASLSETDVAAEGDEAFLFRPRWQVAWDDEEDRDA